MASGGLNVRDGRQGLVPIPIGGDDVVGIGGPDAGLRNGVVLGVVAVDRYEACAILGINNDCHPEHWPELRTTTDPREPSVSVRPLGSPSARKRGLGGAGSDRSGMRVRRLGMAAQQQDLAQV